MDEQGVGMKQSASLSRGQARKEWGRHYCGPGEPERFNDKKRDLEVVRHIAHVDAAQRILADGEVAAALVRDESGVARIAPTFRSIH